MSEKIERKYRLSRAQRLRQSKLFQECRTQRKRYAGRLMVMCLRSGTDASLRLGVIAGRGLGGAVLRNRAKRLLREVYRHQRFCLTGAYDIILIARSGLECANRQEVEKDFLKLARQAKILNLSYQGNPRSGCES